VGRLDLNSEGLLLLTNDGELSRRLELPSTGWVRRYKVRIHGSLAPQQLASLEHGLTIDGVRYGPIKAALERQQGANSWLTVGLTEGKNREIRRVFEHLGVTVNRLIRLSYGPFQLGALERGKIEEVPRRVLRDQLGLGAVGDKGRVTKAAKPEPEPAEPAKPARMPKPHHAGPPDRRPVKPRTLKLASSKTNGTKSSGGKPDADRRR
jgi:23S rRNA pseudouridine2605 synthase